MDQRIRMNVCHNNNIKGSIILKLKLESLLLTHARRKTGDSFPLRIEESVFGVDGQAKPGESVFDVGIIQPARPGKIAPGGSKK